MAMNLMYTSQNLLYSVALPQHMRMPTQ